ncbi:hypothetical protein CBR_g5637 [Chara braunii]|uniref:DUF659 domain-containing protein n=1 Tax=Chara braunii TaxID=69332 RepID=A0A388JRR4_CHABU|nr:hypothetical protein CBR_g5637 [Chara braunii]|eukprot:GBG60463.1 hypothetical protein CBR_g5637 [Chara braunii]
MGTGAEGKGPTEGGGEDDVQELGASLERGAFKVGRTPHQTRPGATMDGRGKRRAGTAPAASVPDTKCLKQVRLDELYDPEWQATFDHLFLQWWYISGVPFERARMPEYRALTKHLQNMPRGMKPALPQYKRIAGSGIQAERAYIADKLRDIREQMQHTGATILTDGRKSLNSEPIVKFLTAGQAGALLFTTVRREVVDAETSDVVLQRWKKVFEKFGEKNINAIYTNSASVYVAAGRALCNDPDPDIHRIPWLPCSVHCCNLMLLDMVKDKIWAIELLTSARAIVRFIRSHGSALALFRIYNARADRDARADRVSGNAHIGEGTAGRARRGRELLYPCETRFTSVHIMMERDHRVALETMMLEGERARLPWERKLLGQAGWVRTQDEEVEYDPPTDPQAADEMEAEAWTDPEDLEQGGSDTRDAGEEFGGESDDGAASDMRSRDRQSHCRPDRMSPPLTRSVVARGRRLCDPRARTIKVTMEMPPMMRTTTTRERVMDSTFEMGASMGYRASTAVGRLRTGRGAPPLLLLAPVQWAGALAAGRDLVWRCLARWGACSDSDFAHHIGSVFGGVSSGMLTEAARASGHDQGEGDGVYCGGGHCREISSSTHDGLVDVVDGGGLHTEGHVVNRAYGEKEHEGVGLGGLCGPSDTGLPTTHEVHGGDGAAMTDAGGLLGCDGTEVEGDRVLVGVAAMEDVVANDPQDGPVVVDAVVVHRNKEERQVDSEDVIAATVKAHTPTMSPLERHTVGIDPVMGRSRHLSKRLWEAVPPSSFVPVSPPTLGGIGDIGRSMEMADLFEQLTGQRVIEPGGVSWGARSVAAGTRPACAGAVSGRGGKSGGSVVGGGCGPTIVGGRSGLLGGSVGGGEGSAAAATAGGRGHVQGCPSRLSKAKGKSVSWSGINRVTHKLKDAMPGITGERRDRGGRLTEMFADAAGWVRKGDRFEHPGVGSSCVAERQGDQMVAPPSRPPKAVAAQRDG